MHVTRGDVPAEVSNMLRCGTVIEVRTRPQAAARVQTGEIQTDWIPWLERRIGPNGRTWHAPGTGEQVLLACPGGDISQAIVLGSLAQTDYAHGADSQDVDRTVYPDGSSVEFNHATSTLTVAAGKGQVIVHCQQAEVHAGAAVVLDTPTTRATGSVSAEGNVSAGTGATGTLCTTTGQVVTIERGSVTNVYGGAPGRMAGLPFNPEPFERLADQINAVRTCEELQALADQALQSANTLLAGIGAQLAALKPIMALLTAPGANPAQIVTWITDFISAFLQPYVQPMMVLPAQIAGVSAAIANLQSAITAAASRIGSCSIELPPIEAPELPGTP